MRIENDVKLDFSDVLIRPKRSTLRSRKGVSVEREYVFLHSQQKYSGVPIIAANMDTVGTFEMARELGRNKLSTALHKFYSNEQLLSFYSEPEMAEQAIFYSMGIAEPDYNKFVEFEKMSSDRGMDIKYLCVDVANGYSELFVEFISNLRAKYPNKVIMAGNVVTGEMTEELILSGADIVKIGIGPGSACTTRKVAGVGYPQLSAVIECADAAHGLKGLICSDGGCVMPADLAKAFGAGADFVMLGGMLAAHDESGGEKVVENGKEYRKFYGMSSTDAMDKYFGGVAEYRASEGRSVVLPARGPVKNTIQEILGGIRSACTYVGAQSLKELSKRTTFIRVNNLYNKTYEKNT